MSEQALAHVSRDLADLVAEVLAGIPRLLALQDRDPDSPMRGCFHPAFWRDKSSDVADMRRQEASLALAWAWKHPFAGNRFRGSREVLQASLRGLGFWTRQQHSDGTFDEWYRNEHGYATTAFSSYAVALTVEALGEALPGDLRTAVVAALRRAGTWLTTHDDWFKTNHEAVGVAALAATGRLLGEPAFLEAAGRNARLIASRQEPEGWSREITGADAGYSFLLAEYLAMACVLTGDDTGLEPALRAFRFAATFLHPDLTTGAEYGICGNPYFSRVAAVALAPHDPTAAAALSWMGREIGPRDTSATLKDDLRLARYAYQPLLAALLQAGVLPRLDESRSEVAKEQLLFEHREQNRWFPGAGLMAVARKAYAAWAAPVQGGFVRVAFRDGGGFHGCVADRGYALARPPHTLRNARYDPATPGTWKDGVLAVAAPFVRTAFVMPPYWARVGLRLATSLPGGPRWSRKLIDIWRRRKGTALNQSAGGISGGRAPVTLERELRFHDDRVEIRDRLVSRDGPLDPATTFLVLDALPLADGTWPDADRRIPLTRVPHRVEGNTLVVSKTLRVGPDGPVMTASEPVPRPKHATHD